MSLTDQEKQKIEAEISKLQRKLDILMNCGKSTVKVSEEIEEQLKKLNR
jgi:conjugal transfer/entry exclusion protein